MTFAFMTFAFMTFAFMTFAFFHPVHRQRPAKGIAVRWMHAVTPH